MQQPIPIPEEPHDATFFDDKVAICTSKAIYMMEPMKYVCCLLIGDRKLTVLKVRPIHAIKWRLRIHIKIQMLSSGYLNKRRRS